jgi:iron-sulfur cluster assembly accessory protein
MSFEITPRAEKFIKLMLRVDGGPGAGFRLAVKPGGCSGLSSEIAVQATPDAGDAVIERNGFRLFLPAESRLLLDGVTIDFADTPMQSGFVFHDPKHVACDAHVKPLVLTTITQSAD